MSFLYLFAIRLLGTGIFLAQLINPKAKKWVRGRQEQWKNWPEVPKGRRVIWFHCASLGEFDQGLPLMDRIKEEDPEVFLLLTFFSPSGFEHYHKRKHQVDYACYLPLDLPSRASTFLDHFRPEQAYFVKYEYWHFFLREAHKRAVDCYAVCAIFRKDHRFFKWYGAFFRKTLTFMKHFFVQNKESLELLHQIGIRNLSLVGDMRFDRVIEHRKSLVSDTVIEQFLEGERAFILGSSWSEGEAMLESGIKSYVEQGKVIIAPHDIGEAHLKEIEQRFRGQCIRYSRMSEHQGENILLIDCIGKLANAYQYGKFAYVGGGFKGSLHNILEPAVFGLPVLFGPKHDRFPEGDLFLESGVAFELRKEADFPVILKAIESANDWEQKLGALIESQRGAAELIYQINFVKS
ncbi:MAG: 3-deoxy-D-manno-octulosonic acid transferase [Bacteroidetes bacterium]|nr:MAG: 3-deoxy-D-manno-octulosonic acid transferase [Bacteroidota bacterium]